MDKPYAALRQAAGQRAISRKKESTLACDTPIHTGQSAFQLADQRARTIAQDADDSAHPAMRKLGLACVLIRLVAIKAIFRQYRTEIAIETNWIMRPRAAGTKTSRRKEQKRDRSGMPEKR